MQTNFRRVFVSERVRFLPIILVGFLISVLIAGFGAAHDFGAETIDVPLAVPLILGCALVIGIPMVRRLQRGIDDLFDPVIVFGVIFSFAYILPAITLLRGTNAVWAGWRGRAIGAESILLGTSLRYALLAAMAWQIGYAIPQMARLAAAAPIPRPVWHPERMRIALVAYLALGIVLLTLFVRAVGGIGGVLNGLYNRLQAFGGLGYLVFGAHIVGAAMMLWYVAISRREGSWPLKIAIIGVGLAAKVVTGQKVSVLGFVVVIVIASHYLTRRIRLWQGVVLALVGVLLFVGYGLYFREYIVRGYAELDVSGMGLSPVEAIWWRFTRSTFLQLESLMLIVDTWPAHSEYLGGSTIQSLIFAPLPGNLFPATSLSSTVIFSGIIFPDLVARGTTIPPSLVGDFYMNFGQIGVAVGMLLFGAFYRFFYEYLLRDPRNPGLVLIYALTCTNMIHWIRGEVSSATVLWLMQLLPVVAALIYCSGFQGKEHNKQQPSGMGSP